MTTPLPPSPTLPGAARPVRVHGIGDARAALMAAAALGRPVVLVGPPGGGALWFARMVEAARAAVPGAEAEAVLDCADRAGDAQGALAAGVRHVLFSGPPEVAARLADIAARSGAVVLPALAPALDLRGERDPQRACQAWLADG
ncbi:hypothetical protein [Azospirillum sp. sgz301742]